MKLAIVVGQVVSTVKCKSLFGDPLLIVDYVDNDGKPCGNRHVAADPIGAGNGEWVLVVEGSSARLATNAEGAIDLSIVGIVDEVTIQGKAIFHK
ncbi:EutN/CcmL family microcompartment protein [Noviherbaspirillum saxi]|uniref:Ethanolamine utilization microcompartment protein EutN n=1 Tax=Noviherbaspirillum saxi TaxID=2320863 RepID=A0A3A3FFE7_9BURK|nr:EutN/CcmL family microcompartment protein [Noviherbaspirillum saxi]RJF92061.1 ethanolamine utilization microcompartment protein EutN [Noviherbaspirillum saxi]